MTGLGSRPAKEYLGRAADYLNAKYGAGTVELVLRDSYYNMREQIEPHMYLILRARAAMEAAGGDPGGGAHPGAAPTGRG